jgi:hypothetical protein
MITRRFYACCLTRIYITVSVPLFRKQQDFPLNDTPFLDPTSLQRDQKLFTRPNICLL